MNKKGAELTVGTIVIIVLAVIVLVVLVLGFTGGWGNLWQRVSGIFSKSNVDSVIQACQVACTTQSENDFCYSKRTVILEDKSRFEFSCFALGLLQYEYGFRLCEDIKCSNLDCVKDLGGKWEEPIITREKDGKIDRKNSVVCGGIEEFLKDESFARRIGLTQENKNTRHVWFIEGSDGLIPKELIVRKKETYDLIRDSVAILGDKKQEVCCLVLAEFGE